MFFTGGRLLLRRLKSSLSRALPISQPELVARWPMQSESACRAHEVMSLSYDTAPDGVVATNFRPFQSFAFHGVAKRCILGVRKQADLIYKKFGEIVDNVCNYSYPARINNYRNSANDCSIRRNRCSRARAPACSSSCL